MTLRDQTRSAGRLPRAIYMLGLVSLFMDVSSEMIHGLLPVFLVVALGASGTTVGLIEGVAEATASVTRALSGAWSDRMGRRKPLALAGYGLAALTRPLFPLAESVAQVFAARFADRLGKGIRVAPRDSLVADLAPAGLRGAAFGMRQSLDTVGAFVGPLLAILLMAATGDDLRLVLWVAVAPAFVSVAVLAFCVGEPRREEQAGAVGARPWSGGLAGLGGAFWALLSIAFVLLLARFSEAFLLLRAERAGLALGLVPVVLVAMNVAYAATAYPAGRLSDRIGRRGMLIAGFAVLVAADLVLALAAGVPGVLAGVVLWGVHMGLSQGILAALVADVAPAPRRGTAFGLFHLAAGLAVLAASAGAGWLWDRLGPEAP
ncbi:MAG: MFS transporter, partial [Alphaproteobacteria bacterium]